MNQQGINAVGYDGKRWILIDETTQRMLRVGDIRHTFNGDAYLIGGGSAPHKPSSTGKIRTAQGREFYPSVVGARWVRL